MTTGRSTSSRQMRPPLGGPRGRPVDSTGGYRDGQLDYVPDLTVAPNGVQILGWVQLLDPDDYLESVVAIEALEPPMPSYEAFGREPDEVYVPLIETA